MHKIDEDHSNTITAAEFIENIVKFLETGIQSETIIQELMNPQDGKEKLQINQSGTFFEYEFDN